MSAAGGERRIPIGPLIGLAGAVLLAVSLFLDWWDGLTAFTVFEALDLVLGCLALAAMVALAGPLGARLPGNAGPRPSLALPLGVAAAVIVVSQLLNYPPAVGGSESGPEVGLWLALGGSLLMLAGGLLSAARISLALDLEPRRPAAESEQTAEVGDASAEAGRSSAAREQSAAARRRSRARAEAPPDTPGARPAAGEPPTSEAPERPPGRPPG
jgi:hypothetical protein